MEILIPKSAMPKFRCVVPTGVDGEVCNKPFWELEDLMRHAGRCAREHEQEIHDASPRSRLPGIYDPSLGDVEYEQYMRGVGRRMLAEGRVEQRKNER